MAQTAAMIKTPLDSRLVLFRVPPLYVSQVAMAALTFKSGVAYPCLMACKTDKGGEAMCFNGSGDNRIWPDEEVTKLELFFPIRPFQFSITPKGLLNATCKSDSRFLKAKLKKLYSFCMFRYLLSNVYAQSQHLYRAKELNPITDKIPHKVNVKDTISVRYVEADASGPWNTTVGDDYKTQAQTTKMEMKSPRHEPRTSVSPTPVSTNLNSVLGSMINYYSRPPLSQPPAQSKMHGEIQHQLGNLSASDGFNEVVLTMFRKTIDQKNERDAQSSSHMAKRRKVQDTRIQARVL